jgi:hypothetical protein
MCKLQERTKVNRLDEWDDGERAGKRKSKRLDTSTPALNWTLRTLAGRQTIQISAVNRS